MLYKECKKFLETNERNWEQRRIERELEMKKKERLSIADNKREKLKEKVRERKLAEEISNKMNKLPVKERNRLNQEEEINRRQELVETKKSLQKLISRGKLID